MQGEQEHSEELTIALESTKERADAKAVSSSILAVQSFVEEVNSAFRNNERILMKARPFKPGSLEVPLELIVLGAAIVLQEHPLLLKLRDVIAQYFDIKLRLKGRPLQVKDGNVIIIENSHVHVDELTLKCLDPTSVVSQKCSEAFQSIEQDTEVTGVRVRSAWTGQQLVTVPRDQFTYLCPAIPADMDGLGVSHMETRETLVIRQPAFDAELAWRFVWRGSKISAKVLDETFQRSVDAGLESFASGDTLDVTLRRRQEYDPAVQTSIDKDYTITRVWKHCRKEEQKELFE